MKQIKVELNMLDTCQLKIDVRLSQLISYQLLFLLLLLLYFFYSKK